MESGAWGLGKRRDDARGPGGSGGKRRGGGPRGLPPSARTRPGAPGKKRARKPGGPDAGERAALKAQRQNEKQQHRQVRKQRLEGKRKRRDEKRRAKKRERAENRRARRAKRQARRLAALIALQESLRRFGRWVWPSYTRRLPPGQAVAVFVLNVFPPGLGTIVYGRWGRGVLQFLLSFVFLLGWVWSVSDGIRILLRAFESQRRAVVREKRTAGSRR